MAVKLMRYGQDEPVKEGDQLTLIKTGDWCYMVSFRGSLEDDDPGRVTIRFPWAETKDVEPSAVGCYIREK